MIQTIDISLIPSDNKPVINVSQFDNISRVLRFNVFDDAGMEVPHVFDNTETVLLNIRKNDNNIVVITGVIVSDIDPETQEVTGQYITFELTEQACACVGSNFGEVSITSGENEIIGSCNFKLLVERSPLSGGVSSQTAIDNLTTQIEEITEQVIGANYYDKQEIDNKFDNLHIPTKTSDLENDSGFITAASLPTKTSDLENDSGFITAASLPTKTSDLENDSGFTTIDDNATVNDKTWSSDKISDELYELLPVGSASGEIASFNTALAKPLLSCVVDENATKLTKCGVNLWDEEWELGGIDTITGLNVNANDRIRSVNFIPINVGNDIYFVIGSNYTIGMRYYAEDKSFLGTRALTESKKLVYGTIDLPTGTFFIRFMILNLTEYNNNISVNYPASITTYNQYKHVDYDLPLMSNPITYIGDNNIFADIGEVSLTYKDTIQHYIDTRVNTVSNRSLSMQRTLETLEKSVTLEKSSELERGDNNENER